MVRYATNLVKKREEKQKHFRSSIEFFVVFQPLISGNEPNSYCKCYLFPDEFKSSKRKGKIILNSRNPIFNDTVSRIDKKKSQMKFSNFRRFSLLTKWI